MKSKFEVGEIITNKRGWRRKIVSVIENYLNDGRIGYQYLSENYPELEFVYPGMCSQEHLINWSRK